MIVSKKQHAPALSVPIRGYIRFYEPLLPHRDRFVTGTFEEVTTDLAAVIRRINRRFGTAFHEFQHTEENVKSVFADIERDYSGAYEEGAPLELVVARPSSVRDEARAGMHTRFRSEVHAGLRLRASSTPPSGRPKAHPPTSAAG